MACAPASGDLKGGVTARDNAKASADSDSAKAEPSAPNTGVSQGTITPEDDKVAIPGAITGALLVCFNEDVLQKTAHVACGVVDETTKKKLNLSALYSSFNFTVQGPVNLSLAEVSTVRVTKEYLSSYSQWHLRFTITADSAEELNKNLPLFKFGFNETDPNGQLRSLPSIPSAATKPVLLPPPLVRGGTLMADGKYRCLDRMQIGESSYKVVSFQCNTNGTQVWTLSADNKLVNDMGQCLNVIAGAGVLSNCADAATPTWVVVGEQFKNALTGTCLTETDAINTANISSQLGLAACNTADSRQHWAVGSN